MDTGVGGVDCRTRSATFYENDAGGTRRVGVNPEEVSRLLKIEGFADLKATSYNASLDLGCENRLFSWDQNRAARGKRPTDRVGGVC